MKPETKKLTLVVFTAVLLITMAVLITFWQKSQTKFQPLSGKVIDSISKNLWLESIFR